jgi:DNA-directed RNA polymerase sigma subunit (sigma70/sigma32)
MASTGGEDMTTHWLQQAGRIPMLTPAEALHLGGLVRQWQDWLPSSDEAPAAVRRRGLRARDRMVSANLRLVVAVATKRRSYEAPLVDRLQSGAIGLARAVEKFDPARGYTFSTYAYWWIRQAIDAGDLAEGTIYLPAPVHAAVRGRRNGSCSAPCLEAALATAAPLSMDAPLPGDRDGNPSTLADLIAAPEPAADDLQELMETLDPIEQRLITGRWRLDDQHRTLSQLATQEAISVGEVRKILTQAMGKLRGVSTVDPVAVQPANPWPIPRVALQADQLELLPAPAQPPEPGPAAAGDQKSSRGPVLNQAALRGRGGAVGGSFAEQLPIPAACSS